MIRIRLKILIGLILSLNLGFVSCNQGEPMVYADQIRLSEGWQVQSSANITQKGEVLSTPEAVTDTWFPATVPSTVMGVLMANGQYQDLFVGMNYQEADKTPFDVSWWYRIPFKSPAVRDGQRIQLHFDGLSYRADIWLNGKQIGKKEEIYGAFCQFEFDVTDLLEEENVLAVEVFRAREGEPNIGFVDWNPRPLDENMGIFRDVTLRASGQVDLKNTWVRSDVNKETLDEAWLTIETQLANLGDQKVKGKIEGRIEDIRFSVPVTLEPGETGSVSISPEDVKSLHILHPRLWWCKQLGDPELYDLELRFVTGKQVSDVENIRFGIREIETYLTGNDHKGFLLNGKKVLIRSAGWTDDLFLRNTPEDYDTQIRYVSDMNLNSIRLENVWGTGPELYDLCDANGIMVMVGWSCQWEWKNYFGAPDNKFGCIHSEHDMNLLVRYLKDQMHWLRNHPSIIAWLGGSDKLLDPELERRYMEIWPQLTQVPFVGSAARRKSEVTGPSGMKMEGPYDYVGPNYWFIDTVAGGNYGFNTETGTGSQIPAYESLLKMIPADKLWPLNEYWDYHTTASESMNSMKPTVDAIHAMYGKPSDLRSFLNRAYLLNMQATQSMFEAFRVNPAQATGIVQWMLNSAFPSVYWQLYDYYKIPVASYYGVKRGNAPIQLIYNYKDNGIYLVNGTGRSSGKLTAVIRGYDIDSQLLFEERKEIASMEASDVKTLFTVDNSAKNTFLFLNLLDERGMRIADNFYCLSSKPDVYDWKNKSWLTTPIASYGDFKDLAYLPQANLKIRTTALTDGQDGWNVTLENDSSILALLVQLAVTDVERELVAPVYWSDNYISLPPGEKIVLRCHFYGHENLKPESLKVTGWNIAEQRIPLN